MAWELRQPVMWTREGEHKKNNNASGDAGVACLQDKMTTLQLLVDHRILCLLFASLCCFPAQFDPCNQNMARGCPLNMTRLTLHLTSLLVPLPPSLPPVQLVRRPLGRCGACSLDAVEWLGERKGWWLWL